MKTLTLTLAGPLISSFVSSAAYVRLIAAAPRRAKPVTAVFAEAAPSAQMQLIRRLYRRKVVVGVLLLLLYVCNSIIIHAYHILRRITPPLLAGCCKARRGEANWARACTHVHTHTHTHTHTWRRTWRRWG